MSHEIYLFHFLEIRHKNHLKNTMSKKLIVQTVAFGQGRPSLTDATAARFNTPTASPPTPTHRAAEARIKNEPEREQQRGCKLHFGLKLPIPYATYVCVVGRLVFPGPVHYYECPRPSRRPV